MFEVLHSRFRTATIALAGVLALFGTSAWASRPPLKIGVGRVFPISYRDPDGKYVGFAADVLNEAARREGIAVDWKPTNGSTDAEDALRSGRIDLMPAGMVTPARQQMFYVSEPWWSLESTVVARVDHRSLKRLAINSIYTEMVAKAFPNVVLVSYPWADWAIAAACKGEVDGAIVGDGELPDILLHGPAGCTGVHLTSGRSPIAMQLALISRKADAWIASRLRSRIDKMALDGTLMRMAAKNPPISIGSVAMFEDRLRARFKQHLWIVGGIILSCCLVGFLWSRERNHNNLRKANSALQHAHARLALKHEVARMGGFEWFVRENRVEWSPEMEKLYGIESADHRHTFEEWKVFVHPDDLEPTLMAMDAAVRNRQSTLDATYRIVRRDGTLAWIHSRSKYEYDASGQPVHMLGVNMDMTEMKRAEEELQRASRTMSMALEAGNSGAWIWNIETGELTWSETNYRLLGIDPTTKPSLEVFYSVVHPNDLKLLKKNLTEAVEGRLNEFRIEFRILKPDGVHWIERRGRVFRNHENKPIQIVGITTDVTEHKVLRGRLPTCAQCKKIRDEHDHWHVLEEYITDHSEAKFSHGLCPDCLDQYVKASDIQVA